MRSLFLALLASGALARAGGITAGAAKRVITPDLARFSPVYIAGFGQNRVATGVHDDLYARCLAITVDSRPPYRGIGSVDPTARGVPAQPVPLVLCGVDSIGLFLDDTRRVRAGIEQKAGRAHVVIAALHDHESPDTMGLWGPAFGKSGLNPEYNQFVIDRTVEAALEALRTAAPASLVLGRTHPPELDTLIHDTRPPVVHDAELLVLSAVGANGKRIGTLVNWANHPEALGSKNTLLTADYPAALYETLERKLGGVAVFVNGAVGGMQSPLGATVKDAAGAKLPADSFEFAARVGTRVAELAAEAAGKGETVDTGRLEFRERRVTIPVTNAGFKAAAQAGVFRGKKPMDGDATETVVGYARLSVGSKAMLEIAMIPGEMYPELSLGGIERYEGADFPQALFEKPVKQMMTAPYRMLIGLANDEIGYIIPRGEWDEKAPWLQNAGKRWYGEVNSVGPDAAPAIAEAFEELVKAR